MSLFDSHRTECFIKENLSTLTLFKEGTANRWVDPCQVSEENLCALVVLEEVKTAALSMQDGEALDIVEQQAGKVRVGTAQFLHTFFSVKLLLIHSVLKDLGRPLNIVLQHQSATKQVICLERVATNSFTLLIELVDDLIDVGLHATFVHLHSTNHQLIDTFGPSFMRKKVTYLDPDLGKYCKAIILIDTLENAKSSFGKIRSVNAHLSDDFDGQTIGTSVRKINTTSETRTYNSGFLVLLSRLSNLL